MLVIACSNGLGRSSRVPAHQRPCASRWISPALTSMTRKPRSGWAITMSASPSRSPLVGADRPIQATFWKIR